MTIYWYLALYIVIYYDYEGIQDDWTGPEETFNRGYGDCEEFALLFANICYFSTGIKCDIIATTMHQRGYNAKVVDGGIPNHIAVRMAYFIIIGFVYYIFLI